MYIKRLYGVIDMAKEIIQIVDEDTGDIIDVEIDTTKVDITKI